jgi:hypothetical protein
MGHVMVAGLLVLLAIGQIEVTPEQQLNRARTCYGVLDFDCAEKSLALVRARLDRLAPELRDEALRISAEVALSRDRPADAERFLIDLLVRTPRFKPRDGAWPPAWRAALDRARNRVPDRAPPRVTISPLPSTLAPGTALLVRAIIVDATGVDRAELHLRGARMIMTSTGSATWSALVPPEQVRAPRLELSIWAMDLHGRATTTSTVIVPVAELQASLPPPAPPPAEPEGGGGWVIWVALGAAVVGGALAVALIATAGDEPGSVTARIQWP